MAPTTGSAFEVTITALDGADALDAAYTGPQCLTLSGPDNAPGGTTPDYQAQGDCSAGSSVVFTNGLATVSVTLVDPEMTTLEVTDNSSGMSGTSESITVAGAATTSTATATPSTTGPSSTTTTTLGPTTSPTGTTTTTSPPTPTSATGPGFFSVGPATSTPTAGSAFEVTITALDGADALDAAYTGPQCLTFSGPDNAPGGTTPDYQAQGDCSAGGSVVFTNGLATVSVTLVDPEMTTLEVTDNSSGASGVSVPITVTTTDAGTTSTGTTTTGSTTSTATTAGTTTTGSTTTTAGTTTTGSTTTTTTTAGTTTTTSSTTTTTTSSTSTTAGTTTTTLTTTPQN